MMAVTNGLPGMTGKVFAVLTGQRPGSLPTAPTVESYDDWAGPYGLSRPTSDVSEPARYPNYGVGVFRRIHN